MKRIIRRFVKSGENTQALQLSGMIRFAFMFLQGVFLVKIGVSHALIGLIELLFFLSEFSRYFILNGTKIAAFAWSGDNRATRRTRFYTIHLFAFVSVFVLLLSYFFYTSGSEIDLFRLFLLILLTYFMIISEQFDWIFIEKGIASQIVPYSILVYSLQALLVCVTIYYGTINIMLAAVSGLLIVRSLHCHWTLRSDQFNKEAVKAFAVVVTPIILQALVTGIMPFIDLWIVEYSFDETTFLYFRYGARQFPIFMILLAGLRQGLLIKLRRKSIEEKSSEIKKEIKIHAHLIFLPAIGLMLLSPILYTLVYDASFVVSAYIFNVYLLILIFHVAIVQVFFYLENKEWVLLRFSMIEAVINLGFSIWLAYLYGIMGVIWGTVIANLIIKVAYFYWLHKHLGITIQEVLPVKTYALYSGLLILSFIFAIYIYGYG